MDDLMCIVIMFLLLLFFLVGYVVGRCVEYEDPVNKIKSIPDSAEHAARLRRLYHSHAQTYHQK